MEYGIKASDRRVLRICRILGIKSVIKSNPGGKYGSKAKAQHICENLLNREFHTDSPLTKTATDVTELKVPVRMPGATEQKVYKVYLSAILDLCGYNIVSFEMSNHNDTPLAVATLDEAMRLNPGAKFLIHTDREAPIQAENTKPESSIMDLPKVCPVRGNAWIMQLWKASGEC